MSGVDQSWFFGAPDAFDFFVRRQFFTGPTDLIPPVPPLPAPHGQPAHVSRYRGVGVVSIAPYRGTQVHLRPRYKGVRVMAPLMAENKPTPEADKRRYAGSYVIRKTGR